MEPFPNSRYCHPRIIGGDSRIVRGYSRKAGRYPHITGATPRMISGYPHVLGGNPRIIGANIHVMRGYPRIASVYSRMAGGCPRAISGSHYRGCYLQLVSNCRNQRYKNDAYLECGGSDAALDSVI